MFFDVFFKSFDLLIHPSKHGIWGWMFIVGVIFILVWIVSIFRKFLNPEIIWATNNNIDKLPKKERRKAIEAYKKVYYENQKKMVAEIEKEAVEISTQIPSSNDSEAAADGSPGQQSPESPISTPPNQDSTHNIV